jgi:hypothetical protein
VIANEWPLILIGALSLLLGGFILFVPTIVLWIGLYALTFGIFLLVLASAGSGMWRLRARPRTRYTLACQRRCIYRPCSERAFGEFNDPSLEGFDASHSVDIYWGFLADDTRLTPWFGRCLGQPPIRLIRAGLRRAGRARVGGDQCEPGLDPLVGCRITIRIPTSNNVLGRTT